jgi:hypothetical protein
VSKIDLHLHSTASDGKLSPVDIVRKSAKRGLIVIALADHDTVDGIAPALAAAKAFPQLKVIPCVEISTYFSEGEIHMLGYFIDYTHQGLLKALERMRESRKTRARNMIDKLVELGYPLDWRRVLKLAGDGTIGRPHVALAMLEKGYVGSYQEAFTAYLSWGKPAYVERDKMCPEEAIELILQANGLPVLAHPLTLNTPETMVTALKVAGLVGIEAYYNDYTAGEISKLVSLADRHGLITTGGSDYHGLDNNTETMIGGADVPIESAEQLIALVK